MKVLGFETSCDETGIAIYDSNEGLVAHKLYSQASMHEAFGGVVPELASRDHIRKIEPLLASLLEDAKLGLDDIDLIVYTKGPGLVGALLVGASFANSLAFSLGIPALGVHHLEAHLVAPLLEDPSIGYPHLALLVSGGHTQLLLVEAFGKYKLLGESLDDAVGEAFDKTAKLLGLPYPGGPHLSKLAEEGDTSTYRFPRPMVNRPGLDFSFSGLKTFALNTWQASGQSAQDKANIAACFEQSICQTLAIKCERAMKETGVFRLVVSGGVSANQPLRKTLTRLADKHKGKVYFPKLEFCTDNGAMVAYLGFLKAQASMPSLNPDYPIEVQARMPFS
jgi:N6-L-threonylcarbamoyladenine synthase